MMHDYLSQSYIVEKVEQCVEIIALLYSRGHHCLMSDFFYTRGQPRLMR